MGNKKSGIKDSFVDFLLEDEPSKEETTTIAKQEKLAAETHVIADQEDEPLIDNESIVLSQSEEPDLSVQKTSIVNTPTKSTQPDESESFGKVERAQALKIAQEKLKELEATNSKLEFDASQMRSNIEVLQKHNQGLKEEIENLKQKTSSLRDNYKSEIEHLDAKIAGKNKEIEDYKIKIESLDLQLKVDFQKIKSRERELENRIQIMKLENQAMIRSKDQLILDLKRNLDEINLEIENFKDKGRNLHFNYEHAKDKMRKSVKALRLALNLLENDEDELQHKKEEKKSA